MKLSRTRRQRIETHAQLWDLIRYGRATFIFASSGGNLNSTSMFFPILKILHVYQQSPTVSYVRSMMRGPRSGPVFALGCMACQEPALRLLDGWVLTAPKMAHDNFKISRHMRLTSWTYKCLSLSDSKRYEALLK